MSKALPLEPNKVYLVLSPINPEKIDGEFKGEFVDTTPAETKPGDGNNALSVVCRGLLALIETDLELVRAAGEEGFKRDAQQPVKDMTS